MFTPYVSQINGHYYWTYVLFWRWMMSQDTIFGGPKKLAQFYQSTLRQCFICVNIYIGIVIIHVCLLKCEYCRFKIDHFALFTQSLWYFMFFLLNSYILLVYFLVHFTILIDLLLHLYLETVLHVILFMVKSLMNSVNSLLHLIYVHCFPFVIFQRSKLSHVFHRKVPMIWCVLIWNS